MATTTASEISERFGDNLLGLLDDGAFASPLNRSALQPAVAELRTSLVFENELATEEARARWDQ